MTSIADAITLLRQGTCALYGRHEAAKTCDVCVRVEAAVRAIEALALAADPELHAHITAARIARVEADDLARWAGSWNLALSSPAYALRPGAPRDEISAAKVRADAAVGPAMRRLHALCRGGR